MNTIGELNKKAWYRLLKVIFITSFLLIFVGIGAISYFKYEPEYHKNDSVVKCDNGRVLNYDKHQIEYDYIGATDNKRIKFECSQTEDGLSDEETEIVEYGVESGMTQDDVLKAISRYRQEKIQSESIAAMSKNYEFVAEYESRDWSRTLLFFFVFNLISLGLFELIRRVFYYIVLGSANPEK